MSEFSSGSADGGAERALIEEVASSWRPQRAGGVGSSSAWHDLSEDSREEAYALAKLNRRLEASFDIDGFHHTIHAVLRKIRAK